MWKLVKMLNYYVTSKFKCTVINFYFCENFQFIYVLKIINFQRLIKVVTYILNFKYNKCCYIDKYNLKLSLNNLEIKLILLFIERWRNTLKKFGLRTWDTKKHLVIESYTGWPKNLEKPGIWQVRQNKKPGIL